MPLLIALTFVVWAATAALTWGLWRAEREEDERRER
jgi:hypothetical protein